MLKISYANRVDDSGAIAKLTPSKALIVLTGTALDFTKAPLSSLDACTEGSVKRAFLATNFEGKCDQKCILIAPCSHLSHLIFVGCGPDEKMTPEAVEKAAAQALPAIHPCQHATLITLGGASGFEAHAAFGATLGNYRFRRYRTKKDPSFIPLETLSIAAEKPDQAAHQWASLAAVAQGIYSARDLINEPGNVLYPEEFARRIATLKEIGVDVEILNREELQKLGFGALLGVAMGSEKAPHVVIMTYRGSDDAPIAFVGKGVTFDTGGISIKPAVGMEEMKTDMGGAAVIVGAIEALARRKARAHVIGVVGLVENMPSGSAQRPGDIVTTYSGQTIEVLNTDAEGRLVLADVLAYTRDRFSPRCLIDTATLTGAIVVGLGNINAGLFSNDDTLAETLTQLGKHNAEPVWRMPLSPEYDRQIRSDVADMKNIGGRAGGAITAAQLLARFVGDTPWAHLDIAGVSWRTDACPLQPKGATGFGVRLLEALVRAHEDGTQITK